MFKQKKERGRERGGECIGSSQRIDEKNYWFDRTRKWGRADVEWIEEKDKSSLIERRRHAVKRNSFGFLPFFSYQTRQNLKVQQDTSFVSLDLLKSQSKSNGNTCLGIVC